MKKAFAKDGVSPGYSSFQIVQWQVLNYVAKPSQRHKGSLIIHYVFYLRYGTKELGDEALSSGCSLTSIKDYIQRFPSEEVGKLLLEYSVDVNLDAHESGNVPLLAFAIMRADEAGFSHTAMITLLLAHGADPMAIPRTMWHE
ncbi:hypothetical protein VMCG_09691 [Cytospora schulzeri]|uniref:Uncharacterized protein n=1 Tax=Cytospora schulzeri TaxID=448051 RepID=A0A423VK95_9PEZI|nr:hypothetical protein VMCG_09691 [Valsa malicola]